jgi:hypothetical protein
VAVTVRGRIPLNSCTAWTALPERSYREIRIFSSPSGAAVLPKKQPQTSVSDVVGFHGMDDLKFRRSLRFATQSHDEPDRPLEISFGLLPGHAARFVPLSPMNTPGRSSETISLPAA